MYSSTIALVLKMATWLLFLMAAADLKKQQQKMSIATTSMPNIVLFLRNFKKENNSKNCI